MKNNTNQPYKLFGDRLKFLREQWKQSVEEVSGTLEIDKSDLLAIESGKVLPGDETLAMLINHFLLTEDQADDLRDLANPDQDGSPSTSGLPASMEEVLSKQVVMYLPIDNKIIYTDAMRAHVNDHGVILQFMQQIPGGPQPAVVSRVGMSRDHAEKMIRVLQQTLEHYDLNKKQKFLPPSNSEK